jgi:SAM-dependent methyltransferase
MVPRDQRFIFDEVAELYDRARPSYPDALIEDVISQTAIPPQGQILELGCGSGQATEAFARRGFSLVCLEPGPQLAALARSRLARFDSVEVVSSTFERWSCPVGFFDLVISAQAFHWLDPTIRLRKAAEALRPGGHLAVFGNKPLPRSGSIHAAIQEAYARCAPSLSARLPGTGSSAETLPLQEEIRESRLFTEATVRNYPWSRDYDASAYVDLMQTQSDHRLLPSRELEALSSAVREAIESHGGAVRVEYSARLIMATRGPTSR